MVQFKYNDLMNRYDVKVPITIADEKSMHTIAFIDEHDRITVLDEMSCSLLKSILHNWDEYSFQLEAKERRESEDFNKLMEGDK